MILTYMASVLEEHHEFVLKFLVISRQIRHSGENELGEPPVGFSHSFTLLKTVDLALLLWDGQILESVSSFLGHCLPPLAFIFPTMNLLFDIVASRFACWQRLLSFCGWSPQPCVLHNMNIHMTAGVAEGTIILPALFLQWERASLPSAILFMGCMLVGIALHHLFIAWMRRRIGMEMTTMADILTMSRVASGTLCLGLILAGEDDALIRWFAFVVVLVTATLCDWSDGPLARRLGPTRLGAVLDIEADSWLTLGAAIGAVAWGGLCWFVAAPAVIRYIHPAIAFCQGRLPKGGGPWWSIFTGVAQMVLLVTALAPAQGIMPHSLLVIASWPISGAQLITMIVLLRRSPYISEQQAALSSIRG